MVPSVQVFQVCSAVHDLAVADYSFDFRPGPAHFVGFGSYSRRGEGDCPRGNCELGMGNCELGMGSWALVIGSPSE